MNTVELNAQALQVLAASANFDVVSAYLLKKGDVISFGNLEDERVKLGIERSVDISQVLEEEEVQLLISPLGALYALSPELSENLLGDRVIPETGFSLDREYTIAWVHDGLDGSRHLDVVLEDAEGNSYAIYSGVIGLKTVTVNGKGHEELIREAQASEEAA